MNRPQQHDRSVERWLRRSLHTSRQDEGDACLDAETLAAWIDGGLTGAALESAESHVADCARCQALTGAVIRTSAILPAPERAPRRWLAWLVPLSAAAAALAIWVAVPRDRAVPVPLPPSVASQPVARSSPEPAAPANQTAAPPRVRELQAGQAKSDLVESDQANATELRKDAAERLEAAAAAAPPATPAPPSAADSVARDSGASRAAFGRLAETVTISTDIVSPDPSIRWRLAGSTVQRSTNGGSSWELLPTGVTSPLTAGAAPSVLTCWLVGSAGTVILSTDGRTFSRVAFPEMIDLSSVSAVDARTASVSTADGRTFDTTDGGASWTRR